MTDFPCIDFGQVNHLILIVKYDFVIPIGALKKKKVN